MISAPRSHSLKTVACFTRPVKAASVIVLLALCCLTLSCNVLGVIGMAAPPPEIQASYKGLDGQTVGIMVWVDRSIRIDYPSLQMDVAKGVTSQLVALSHPKSEKERKDFPKELLYSEYLDPMSIIQFQDNHPELEGAPAVDLATRLGVTRVIYIQVFGFQTRPVESIDLYKGTLRARLEVLEVTKKPSGEKTATKVYTDDDITTVYPPRRPEGLAGENVNGKLIYEKTVEAFTSDVVLKFIPHPRKK